MVVPSFPNEGCRNEKQKKTMYQNCKNELFTYFTKNLKIEIKKKFPNQFFVFLLKCVQERVVFDPI